MAWLLDRAENLLNKMDQTAAGALHTDEGPPQPGAVSNLPERTYTPYLSQQSNPTTADAGRPSSTRSTGSSYGQPMSMSVSASVPSNMSRMSDSPNYLNQMSRSSYNQPTQQYSRAPSKGSPAKAAAPSRDKDAELFEFLNDPDTVVDSAKPKMSKYSRSGRHSRQSSGSSIGSHKGPGEAKTPEPGIIAIGGRGSPENQGIKKKNTFIIVFCVISKHKFKQNNYCLLN